VVTLGVAVLCYGHRLLALLLLLLFCLTIAAWFASLQDTLDKMIKAFPGKKKLKPARNYCEVVPLHAPHSCDSTGVLQPPGDSVLPNCTGCFDQSPTMPHCTLRLSKQCHVELVLDYHAPFPPPPSEQLTAPRGAHCRCCIKHMSDMLLLATRHLSSVHVSSHAAFGTETNSNNSFSPAKQCCCCSSGGLAFTLRIEAGTPGQPTGIETCTQVAPVLLAGPRAAEAAHYTTAHQGHAGLASGGSGGMIGQIAALVPGETGQQLQQGVKSMGHKLANFLARV
jgi:hypothetical protein